MKNERKGDLLMGFLIGFVACLCLLSFAIYTYNVEACLPEGSKIIRVGVFVKKCGSVYPIADGLIITLDKVGGRGGDLWETQVTVDGWVQFGDASRDGWIISGSYKLSATIGSKTYSVTVTIDCTKETWTFKYYLYR